MGSTTGIIMRSAYRFNDHTALTNPGGFGTWGTVASAEFESFIQVAIPDGVTSGTLVIPRQTHIINEGATNRILVESVNPGGSIDAMDLSQTLSGQTVGSVPFPDRSAIPASIEIPLSNIPAGTGFLRLRAENADTYATFVMRSGAGGAGLPDPVFHYSEPDTDPRITQLMQLFGISEDKARLIVTIIDQ